jgi:hypothetical protein
MISETRRTGTTDNVTIEAGRAMISETRRTGTTDNVTIEAGRAMISETRRTGTTDNVTISSHLISRRISSLAPRHRSLPTARRRNLRGWRSNAADRI